jgi:hypothetical protein
MAATMAEPWSLELITVVKVTHVLLAAAWVGQSVFMNAVVVPQLLQSTPGTRREFMGRLMPIGIRYGNIVGGLTLLSGLLLVYAMRGSFKLDGTWGKLVTFAFVGNLAILFLLNLTMKPTLKRMAKFQSEVKDATAPPPPQVMFLQRRLMITSSTMLLIVVTVLAVMVMANTHVFD